MSAQTQSESDERSSQIIKNVLMNWAAFAATMVAGFLMSPFLVRHLGDSVYGVWVLVGSLVGYLGLLDFGLTQSSVKYLAEYRARGDQESINRVISCGFAVFSLMGVLSLAVSLTIAFSFNTIFDSPLSEQTAALVVILAGLNLSLTFPASVFVGVIRGYQRYDIDSAITTLTITARSLLLVWLILRGYGIVAVSLVTFAFDGLRLAYLIRRAYRLNPSIQIRRSYLSRQEMKRMFGYSTYAVLMSAGKKIIFYTDSIVIGLFLPISAVTTYFIANRLVTYLLQVSETMGVLTPAASDLDARNDRPALKEMLVITTKYMLLIALPIGAVFFVLGDRFIVLWMGAEHGGSAVILTILTVAVLAHLLEMPAHTLLLGLGKHAVVAWFTLAQAAANLVLSLILVKPYGLAGVAMGTAIPMALFTFIALFVYLRCYLKVAVGDYLRRSMTLPFLVQAPFLVTLLLMKTYTAPSSLAAFFLLVALALIPYAGMVFLVCMSRPERRAIHQVVEKFRLKLYPLFS